MDRKALLAKAHYRNSELEKLEQLFMERFRGRSVLDVGCGNGRNFLLLEKAGCEIYGVDSNQDQVNALAAQGRKVWLPKCMPSDLKVDVVLMSHVIEHLTPRELHVFMDMYLGCLRPEGKLIVLTPVPGERFYYDFTHVRPYLPQSLWMLLGGVDTAASMSAKWKMRLEDIHYFRDAFRPRNARAYYPVPDICPMRRKLVDLMSVAGAWLYLASGFRIGVRASWLGIYGNLEKVANA